MLILDGLFGWSFILSFSNNKKSLEWLSIFRPLDRPLWNCYGNWGEVLIFLFRWLLSASTERVQFCYGCFELQLSSKRVHMRCHYHKSSCRISQDLVRNSWLDVSMFSKQKRSETSRLIKIDTNISNDPRCDLARFRNVSKIKNHFSQNIIFMTLIIREHSWKFAIFVNCLNDYSKCGNAPVTNLI